MKKAFLATLALILAASSFAFSASLGIEGQRLFQWLEIAGHRDRVTVSHRLERLVGTVALEHDDGSRDGRSKPHPRKET